PAKAAPAMRTAALACWFWLLGAVAAGFLAWSIGTDLRSAAGATALAAAPALTGFILMPRLGRFWTDVGFLAVWVLMAAGLAAGSGGASSPLAASSIVAPAWAVALGRRWAPETGAAAVLAYAVAAALSGMH